MKVEHLGGWFLQFEKFPTMEEKIHEMKKCISQSDRLEFVSNWGMDKIKWKILMKALWDNDHLLRLEFTQIRLEIKFHDLCDWLQINHTLKTLILAVNSLKSQDIVSLATALHHNDTLEKLYINLNFCGDAGIIALADLIQVNSTLVYLNLHCVEMEETGAIYLAKILKQNTSLHTLSICESTFSENVIMAFSEALQVNHTLQYFLIQTIHDTIVVKREMLFDILKNNYTLRELNILNSLGMGNQKRNQIFHLSAKNKTLLFFRDFFEMKKRLFRIFFRQECQKRLKIVFCSDYDDATMIFKHGICVEQILHEWWKLARGEEDSTQNFYEMVDENKDNMDILNVKRRWPEFNFYYTNEAEKFIHVVLNDFRVRKICELYYC